MFWEGKGATPIELHVTFLLLHGHTIKSWLNADDQYKLNIIKDEAQNSLQR